MQCAPLAPWMRARSLSEREARSARQCRPTPAKNSGSRLAGQVAPGGVTHSAACEDVEVAGHAQRAAQAIVKAIGAFAFAQGFVGVFREGVMDAGLERERSDDRQVRAEALLESVFVVEGVVGDAELAVGVTDAELHRGVERCQVAGPGGGVNFAVLGDADDANRGAIDFARHIDDADLHAAHAPGDVDDRYLHTVHFLAHVGAGSKRCALDAADDVGACGCGQAVHLVSDVRTGGQGRASDAADHVDAGGDGHALGRGGDVGDHGQVRSADVARDREAGGADHAVNPIGAGEGSSQLGPLDIAAAEADEGGVHAGQISARPAVKQRPRVAGGGALDVEPDAG